MTPSATDQCTYACTVLLLRAHRGRPCCVPRCMTSDHSKLRIDYVLVRWMMWAINLKHETLSSLLVLYVYGLIDDEARQVGDYDDRQGSQQ